MTEDVIKKIHEHCAAIAGKYSLKNESQRQNSKRLEKIATDCERLLNLSCTILHVRPNAYNKIHVKYRIEQIREDKDNSTNHYKNIENTFICGSFAEIIPIIEKQNKE